MKDILNFKDLQQLHAEGKVCIDLTDAITGKVVERVNGKNHVFPSLFNSWAYASGVKTWAESLSMITLLLTNSNREISDDLPYILGSIVGYGQVGSGSSGSQLGAYSAANSVIAQYTGSGIRWKFQYEFTPSQANGTIGTVGLSQQFQTYGTVPQKTVPMPSGASKYHEYSTNDGRYTYSMSTAGIITIQDNYYWTTTSVDVSVIVGTTSADYKYVTYNPSTKEYGVYVYNASTAANRKLHIFSDKTFTTRTAVYSVSNLVPPYTSEGYGIYMYGDALFFPYSTAMYKADYVNNINFVAQNAPTKEPAFFNSTWYYNLIQGTIGRDCYILSTGRYSSSNYCIGYIYDMSTQSFLGSMAPTYTTGNWFGAINHPGMPSGIAVQSDSLSSPLMCCAAAAKKLDVPITKTSSNGMTVTYEVEVTY